MSQLSFSASKDQVIIIHGGKPLAVLGWEFALELGDAYQHVAECAQRREVSLRIVRGEGETRTIRTELGKDGGIRVLALQNGIVVADLEPNAALRLAFALIQVAHLAEEYALHDRVIADQALVMRKLGGALSLSGNPDINSEAWKEAETDSTLRKNIPTPTSIKSRERFGYPQVKKSRTVLETVEAMSAVELEALRAEMRKREGAE